jgi:2-polyprenyl-3-methyl-5-hydroxy-6-metoxy-1,4-benzoquinol methylase
LVAKGTHDWNKFITPEELANMVAKTGMVVEDITGMSYNPLAQNASLDSDTSVNYFLTASK